MSHLITDLEKRGLKTKGAIWETLHTPNNHVTFTLPKMVTARVHISHNATSILFLNGEKKNTTLPATQEAHPHLV